MQGLEIVDKVRKGVSSYMCVDDDFFKTDKDLFDSIDNEGMRWNIWRRRKWLKN